jgi:DNA-binding GntR family transcriptional regulator
VREVVKSSTLTNQVQTLMHNAIASGEWVAGELHSVNEVAKEFGVSRTPVREAALQLANVGLVAFERNVGFRVLRRTPMQIVEIFHLRLLLEVPAVKLTARRKDAAAIKAMRAEFKQMWAVAKAEDEAEFMRHDRAFHDAAISGAGNRRLIDTVQGLRYATGLLGASTTRTRSLSDIAREHRPILNAIAAGDEASAAETMREHIIHTGTLLLAASLRSGDGASELGEAAELWQAVSGSPT